jgi:hypothetical protein
MSYFIRKLLAKAIAFVPVGSLVSTSVQAALAELDTKKADVSTVHSEQYVHIRHEAASGVHAGTFTAGAYRTRPLTTKVSDAGNLATLAVNQITLAAGTYRFRSRAAGYAVGAHKCRLQNVTDSATVKVGSCAYANLNYGGYSDAVVEGRFTIAAGKALELQHFCGYTLANEGFGTATGTGEVEVYAEIEFWKEF